MAKTFQKKDSFPLQVHYQRFPKRSERLAHLEFCRPEVANSLNDSLLTAFKATLINLRNDSSVRAVVLSGKGKHFGAGADLKWMQYCSTASESENLKGAQLLGDCFQLLYELPLPTLALVQGAAVGGSMCFVACCDNAIATPSSVFSLSEGKLGFSAAIILPYLSQKVSSVYLRDWVLTGRKIAALEAREGHLLTQVVARNKVQSALRSWVQGVLEAEPRAISEFKVAHQAWLSGGDRKGFQRESLARKLAHSRAAKPAQEGMKAFFDRRPPDWAIFIPPQWKLETLTNF